MSFRPLAGKQKAVCSEAAGCCGLPTVVAEIIKALRITGRPFIVGVPEYYFCPGAAIGAVADGADIGAVDVGADSVAGFGASCFWHPAKAKIAAKAREAMIAIIFFMFIHPLSPHESNRSAFVAIGINPIKRVAELSSFWVVADPSR